MEIIKQLTKQFLGRESNVYVQFVKYGICGAIATATHMSIFYILAATVIPALAEGDIVVDLFGLEPSVITDARRARNFVINNSAGFVLANLTAYLLNIFWVFKRGKYHWITELAMFYLVSGIAIFVGTVIGSVLIGYFSISTTFAFVVNIFASVMINYALRKFVIFHG